MRRLRPLEWGPTLIVGVVVSASPVALGAEPEAIEEVVVTARRREESLFDVPISTTVLSTLELERRRITDLATLQYAAPNLTVTTWPGSRTRANVGMRGHVETDLVPTVDPAVGVYLDGVYIARVSGANLDFVDVERVEVMRGPQGTLFGRNAIGGAINVIPVKPRREWSGTLVAGVGDYRRRDATAIVNASLGSFGAARIAASHVEHDGYGRNTLLDHDLSEDDRDYARAQLAIAPSGAWDLNLAFDYTRTDAARDWLTLIEAFPPNTLVPATLGRPNDNLDDYQDGFARNVRANRLGATDAEVWGTAATFTLERGRWTFKSITAYRKLDSRDRDADLDATPYDLFTIFDRDEEQRQWSEELQAYGDAFGGRMHWTGGIHWFREEGAYLQRVVAIDPATLRGLMSIPNGSVENESASVYGQLAYSLWPTIYVNAGIRYNEDERQLTSRNARGNDVCVLSPDVIDRPGVCRATLPTRRFDYVPYTLGLDYTPADKTLLFAKVSRGHRAGGYNMRGTTEVNLDTFEPERVTSYEVGGRTELFAGLLVADVTFYRSLFEDIQLVERTATTGSTLTVPVIRNGGKARIEGGELQLIAQLRSLRLSGVVGIIDPRYTSVDPRAIEVTSQSNFLQTPDTTAALAVDLPIRFSFGELGIHADYSWRDDIAFRADPSTLAKQDAYGLANAAISFRLARGDTEILLWGRNLGDERYLDRLTQGSLVTALPGDPRTFGVSLRVDLGAASRPVRKGPSPKAMDAVEAMRL
jgi:iron complex outermembrane receptor protein